MMWHGLKARLGLISNKVGGEVVVEVVVRFLGGGGDVAVDGCAVCVHGVVV